MYYAHTAEDDWLWAQKAMSYYVHCIAELKARTNDVSWIVCT